jgi:tRNA wybutosine-synthesizing protein 3
MAFASSSFLSKKLDILRNLSTPSDSYSDLSPKGSVDIGIRDLIDEINELDGLVTTSSCAGRISVFLEGSRTEERQDRSTSQNVVPGGKGNGGRWLYVSHDPILGPSNKQLEGRSLSKLFGMPNETAVFEGMRPRSTRFAKLQFEPMVISCK